MDSKPEESPIHLHIVDLTAVQKTPHKTIHDMCKAEKTEWEYEAYFECMYHSPISQ